MSKKKAKQFLRPEEWRKFQNEFEGSDDRSCALVLAAYLDQCLEVLLSHAFPNQQTSCNAVFGDQRALGTFASKIDLAFFLNLIPESFQQDLHLIRKIRNQFAHSLHGEAFSKSPNKDRCLSLTTPRDYPTGTDKTIAEMCRLEPRELFVFTGSVLASTLESFCLSRAKAITEKLRQLPTFDEPDD